MATDDCTYETSFPMDDSAEMNSLDVLTAP